MVVLCCFDSCLDGEPDDWLRFLRECRRVLADDGIAIFGRAARDIEALLGPEGFVAWEEAPADGVLATVASRSAVLVARVTPQRPAAPPTYIRGESQNERPLPMTPTIKTTIVIPVRDEERNLYPLFSFLENATNRMGSERKFIVVVNGCQDDSEKVARELVRTSPLNVDVITSEPGIVTAFKAGVSAATNPGFIGKLDADVIVHPHLLDALESHLISDSKLWVTHAEPLPVDTFSRFSEPDHRPDAMSRRLYFNGKASLYRSNPFEWPDVAEFPITPNAEDVFFSFYLAFFVGPRAIGLAPGAFVYQKTISTFDDLVRMLSRTKSEIRALTTAFPGFAPLDLFFGQKIFSPEYEELVRSASAHLEDVDEWLRLESTK